MRLRKVFRYTDCATLQIIHSFSRRKAEMYNASTSGVEVIYSILPELGDSICNVVDCYTEEDARQVLKALSAHSNIKACSL